MKNFEGLNEDPYSGFSEDEKHDFHAHEAMLVQQALGEAGISPDDDDEKTVAFIEDWTQEHHKENVLDFLAHRNQN